jgi:hypothetical protein
MTNRLRLGRIALLLVAVGVCVLGSMPPARAAEPLSLRGFRLGILLADFLITPPPDQTIWPGARPLCSNSPEAAMAGDLPADGGIRVNETEAKAGFVRCTFFYQSGATLAPAGLIIANARTAVSFVFVPDQEGSMRLAWIKATTASANYASVKLALGKKYGRPNSIVRGYAEDAAGTRLVDETVIWSNGASDIRLDQREENVNIQVMTIEYSHEELAAGALKRLNAISGNPADTL